MKAKEIFANNVHHIRNHPSKNPPKKDILKCANALIERGFAPVAITPAGTPHGVSWNAKPLTDLAGNLSAFDPGDGLAVATGVGGVIAFDCDGVDLNQIAKFLPSCNCWRWGRPGHAALFYRWVGNDPHPRSIKGERLEFKAYMNAKGGGLACGVINIPPSHHGQRDIFYQWGEGAIPLWMLSVSQLVPIDESHIQALVGAGLLHPPKDVSGPQSLSQQPAIPLGDWPRDQVMDLTGRTAERFMADIASLAAMQPDSGRNDALYRLVCRYGVYVRDRVIDPAWFETQLLGACQANGLVGDGDDVLATIRSGLERAAGDTFPHRPELTPQQAFTGYDFSKQLPGMIPLGHVQIDNAHSHWNITEFDLSASPDDDAIELFQGLIPGGVGVLTSLAGQSRAGKSVIATQLFTDFALGRPFLNRQPLEYPRGASVAFMASEGGEQFARRVRAILARYGITTGQPLKNCPFLDVSGLNLKNANDYAEVMRMLEPYKDVLKLLILDSATVSCGVKDFNSASEAVEACILLKDFARSIGCPIVGVFHAGKSQDAGISGSHQYTAQSDASLFVSADIEVDGSCSSRSVGLSKHRDEAGGRVCNFGLDIVELGVSRYGLPKRVAVPQVLEDGDVTKSPRNKWLREMILHTYPGNQLPIDELKSHITLDGASLRSAWRRVTEDESFALYFQDLGDGTFKRLDPDQPKKKSVEEVFEGYDFSRQLPGMISLKS